MTVCIAAKADDGKALILAADQMTTMMNVVTETENATKILKLKENLYLLTAGGEFSAREMYKLASRNLKGTTTVEEAVPVVQRAFAKVKLDEAEAQFLAPRGLTISDFIDKQQSLNKDIAAMIDSQMINYAQPNNGNGVMLLLAGINPDGEAKIYEFDPPGIYGEHAAFAAIGSGGTHTTNSLLARRYSANQPEAEAVYLVFEAKKHSEVAPGVGRNTDMYLITKKGEKVYTEAELKKFASIYDELISEERVLLKKKLQNGGEGS